MSELSFETTQPNNKKTVEEELQSRIGLERIIAGISNDFMSVDLENFDKVLVNALRLLGEFTATDRISVFQFSQDGQTFTRTHFWNQSDIDPKFPNFADVPVSEFPWSMEQLREGKIIHIAQTSDLPDEAISERQWTQNVGLKSFLILPMMAKDNLKGILALGALSEERVWADEVVDLLKMFCGIMVTALRRRVTETELRDKEASLATAQRIAHIGSWELDLTNLENIDSNPLRWSDEVFRIFGYEPHTIEVSNENFFRSVHPDDRSRISEAVSTALHEQRPYSIEHRIVRPDGTERIVHEQSEILYDEKTKRPLKMVGTVQDVTERKHVEMQLARHTEDLARSNAELEEFAYIASHDLQEPLRMVSSYVQLLDRRYHDLLDDKGRQFIQFAVEGTQRMQRLIMDLLAYSQVVKASCPGEFVDGTEVVRMALSNLKVAIQESKVEVRIEPLPRIWGERTKLVQVFQNIISNAIKFRSEHHPRIEIGCREQLPFSEFFIRDNGIGMEPKYCERIFQIFQRLHTRDRYPGTGIGLAIVKKIIEQLGGKVWAESHVGKGSVFYFTLPTARREELRAS